MLRDPRGPLALRGLTLRRRLPGAQPQTAFQLGLPLRVLLIVSRPEDTGFVDPRTSTRPVLDALAQTPGGVEVDFCEPPTLPELERQLAAARRERRPHHLVHFDGHGQYYPETGVGALCFEGPEDAGRKTELVPGRHLRDLLSRFQVLLVVIEACRGAQVSDRPIFGAVAPALLQGGVGSVVAFSHSVHVKAAALLVERLYRELVAGASVGEALEEARSALHADAGRWLGPGRRDPGPPGLAHTPALPGRGGPGAGPGRGRRTRDRFRGRGGRGRPHPRLPPAPALRLPGSGPGVAGPGAGAPCPSRCPAPRRGRHGEDGPGPGGGPLVAAHPALRCRPVPQLRAGGRGRGGGAAHRRGAWGRGVRQPAAGRAMGRGGAALPPHPGPGGVGQLRVGAAGLRRVRCADRGRHRPRRVRYADRNRHRPLGYGHRRSAQRTLRPRRALRYGRGRSAQRTLRPMERRSPSCAVRPRT